ncbi:MAG: PIN domain-containing protein [Flavobacteriales bacterium]
MNRYLIDTDICIWFLRGLPLVRERFRTAGYANCTISEITLAELLFGAYRSADPEKNLRRLDVLLADIAVLSTSMAIDRFAREKARLFSQGTPVADFDLLIGATAVHHGLTLVTNNTKHFQRIQGIQLEDWTI